MGGKPRSQRHRDKARVAELLEVLQETWARATCELDHENAYQLLVATILSAQSTDKRVNLVTPELFRRFPDPTSLAGAEIETLEELVRSTGFFRMKSRNIQGMARQVVSDCRGEIPTTMKELTTLPGVARKTANVVLGTAFGIADGIAVDTHVQRLSRRLGLSDESNAEKIERDLMKQVPRDRWIDFSHQLIWHGRRICHARKPACDRCPLAPLCPQAGSV